MLHNNATSGTRYITRFVHEGIAISTQTSLVTTNIPFQVLKYFHRIVFIFKFLALLTFPKSEMLAVLRHFLYVDTLKKISEFYHPNILVCIVGQLIGV